MGRLREREVLSCILVEFGLHSWCISSRFPLTSHFDLPGSESVFGTSQGLLMCVCTYLNQVGF